jgi:hypothetical protein
MITVYISKAAQRYFIGKNLMALERSDVEKNRHWRDWA